jgi:hypothetical protein
MSYLCIPVEGNTYTFSPCVHELLIELLLLTFPSPMNHAIEKLVYRIIGKNVFIIHQRSPCVKGKQSQYCDELVKILNSINYGELIILTGAGTDDIEVMNR